MKKYHAIGRRKTSTARVYLETGKGNILVNKKEFKEYFPLASLQTTVTNPLNLKEINAQFNIRAFVKGGGISGQAGAIQLGIARALLQYEPEWKLPFRKNGFLTRDSREVERKKYGQKGARAKFQYSKR